jgi:hypothetical protein
MEVIYKNADCDGPDYAHLKVRDNKLGSDEGVAFTMAVPGNSSLQRTIALNNEQVRDLIKRLQRVVGDVSPRDSLITVIREG